MNSDNEPIMVIITVRTCEGVMQESISCFHSIHMKIKAYEIMVMVKTCRITQYLWTVFSHMENWRNVEFIHEKCERK